MSITVTTVVTNSNNITSYTIKSNTNDADNTVGNETNNGMILSQQYDTSNNLSTDEYVYEIVYLDNCQFISEDMTIIHICTCGDLFVFKLEDLRKGNNKTECASCSLKAMLQFNSQQLDEFINKHNAIS